MTPETLGNSATTQSPGTSQPLKILYLCGSADLEGAFDSWQQAHQNQNQVSQAHSLAQLPPAKPRSSLGGLMLEDLFDFCYQYQARLYLITPRPQQTWLRGDHILENRPWPWSDKPGVMYHLGSMWYFLGLSWTILRFRPHIVLVSPGRPYWFILHFLTFSGIKFIPFYHCALWPKFGNPSKAQAFLHKLTAYFLCHGCLAILTISDDISRQVKHITQGRNRPIYGFLPIYPKGVFENLAPPDWANKPFRVLFVGRIEVNKGVYTLLEVAKRFWQQGKHDIIFELCGTGTEMTRLNQRAKTAGMDEGHFVCHGHCDAEKLAMIYGRSHVVVVPTTKAFTEGFNRVVVEGILSSRPVVTSAVCIAEASGLDEVVVEVEPESVVGYADAILKLSEDEEFYVARQKACSTVQAKFYDETQGWGHQFRQILLNYGVIQK